MTDKPNRDQLDKDIEQFSKDLKELGKKIEMIGKNRTPDDILKSLIRDDGLFELSHPLKYYKIK